MNSYQKIQAILKECKSKNQKFSDPELLEVLYSLKAVSENLELLLPLIKNNSNTETRLLKIERQLTLRQLHIFKLIGSGLSSKEIAVSLKISIDTVKTHRQNIIRKLKLQGAGQLQRVSSIYYFTSLKKEPFDNYLVKKNKNFH